MSAWTEKCIYAGNVAIRYTRESQYIAGKKFEYPVAIDVEEKDIGGTPKGQLTDAVIAFCEAVEEAGYYICVYANPNWLDNHLEAERLRAYDLWLAHWDVPNPSRDCGIWQYTSNGAINGIDGRADMDVAYKDYTEIMKTAGLNGYSKSDAQPYGCIHEVTKGESPWSLADKYLGDGRRYKEIVALNSLLTEVLYVGQKIKIPNK